MKAEELKINSTYQSVKFNLPIALTAEDIAELVEMAEGADISHYIDEMLKPIPLTEEWLVDFGYGECVLAYGSCEYRHNILPIFTMTMGKNKGVFFAHGVMEDIRIESVHQLQNIYFALTGEEFRVMNN